MNHYQSVYGLMEVFCFYTSNSKSGGGTMNKIAIGLGTLLMLISLNVEAFSLNLTPIGDGPGTSFRWMDIADNLYANNYQATYTYQTATVIVAYNSTATEFFGTLTATGLKPSFAYQMKLVGDPRSVWTNEHSGTPADGGAYNPARAILRTQTMPITKTIQTTYFKDTCCSTFLLPMIKGMPR